MRGKYSVRGVAVLAFFVAFFGWFRGAEAAFTPAACVNAWPSATGVCYDKTGFGHCESTQRDIGACTTNDDHCCIFLNTVPGITKAQCDAKPGFAVSGGCLDSTDDWGVKITDLGAGDWACCKFAAGNPGLCSGSCDAQSCVSQGKVSGSGNCTDPAKPNCCASVGAGACSGSCDAQSCVSQGKTSGTGSCSDPALPNCCVGGSGTEPTPVIATTIFDSPTGYKTVNEFLGKVLSWLQGVLGMLALVMITIGGFMYITSAGDSGQTESAKKLITAAVIGFAIAIAAPSFLREVADILGWGADVRAGLPAGTGTALSFLQILTNALNFLLSIVGIVAIIMLVVGGVMYLTSAGDEDRIDTGKSIVKYAMIGIAVALGALVLVRQLATFF